MDFFKRFIAFSWFAAELKILLMCRLKLSLSSASIPSNSTELCYCFYALFFYLDYLVSSCFHLSIKRTWYLPVLTFHGQNKIVAAIIGYSIFKDVCGWELSEREEKVVVKHFSESTTEYMKTCIQAPVKY